MQSLIREPLLNSGQNNVRVVLPYSNYSAKSQSQLHGDQPEALLNGLHFHRIPKFYCHETYVSEPGKLVASLPSSASHSKKSSKKFQKAISID